MFFCPFFPVSLFSFSLSSFGQIKLVKCSSVDLKTMAMTELEQQAAAEALLDHAETHAASG